MTKRLEDYIPGSQAAKELNGKVIPFSAKQRHKYSRKKKKMRLYFVEGYDLLQYMIAVRPYIEKKHKIDTMTLEYLLFLYPYQYFTRDDFKLIPKYHKQWISLKTLIADGWVELAVKKDGRKNVYGFTGHTHSCIQEFYEYLSGEKTIATVKGKNNPFFLSEDDAAMNKQRWELLRRLRGESERSPSRFRKALFPPVPPREL